jgi:hypothetical protein
LGRNPTCSLARISKVWTCANNLDIIFSNTFENEVNNEIGLLLAQFALSPFLYIYIYI